jgi:hypothetical protein
VAGKKKEPTRKRWPKPVDFKPELFFAKGHAWAGQRRCTAWNPNKGEQCGKRPMKTSRTQKCRSHGGASPKGVASPSYKHGRYSYLPADLLENYEEALEDASLLSMTREVALVEAMMADVLRQWEAEIGGGSSAWADVSEALDFTLLALADQDAQGVADGLNTIKKIVDGSQNSVVFREEFLELAEKKKELVSAEARRMRDMSETMTRGMVILIFSRMLNEIKERAGREIDGGLLIEFSDAFERILIGNVPRGALPHGGGPKSE